MEKVISKSSTNLKPKQKWISLFLFDHVGNEIDRIKKFIQDLKLFYKLNSIITKKKAVVISC